MRAGGSVTAEGDLERTPFAHLLVYAVDRQLTGAMLLTEPSGTEHIVRFVRGMPVKIQPSDGFARFGELLIEQGLLAAETLQDALATTGLLGDVLLLSGRLDSVTLQGVAQTQFVRRMVHLFELPASTTYHYFDRHDVLADWGGDPVVVDPLVVLWAGLREHGERSTRLQSTLALLGPMPLRLHAGFAPGRFDLREAELAVISLLQERALTLAELLESGVAPDALLRKLIYALVITRCLDLGGGSTPVSFDESALSSSSNQALGRVHLRATVHRVGAAAPDPPGDGERAPVQHRTRRRDGQLTMPPATGASGPPPMSAGSLVGAVAAELAAYATPQSPPADAPREPVPTEGESAVSTGADVAPPASKRRVRSGSPEPIEASSDSEVSGVIAIPVGEVAWSGAAAGALSQPPADQDCDEPATESSPTFAGELLAHDPSSSEEG